MVLRAWVDESGSDHDKDPNTYILSAALIPDAAEEDARAALAALRLPGQAKLHWRAESDTRRRQIATTLGNLDSISHVVVVRSTETPDERHERRRRKCMERLLYALAVREVDHVVYESRGRADDRRDQAHLDALRRQHALPRPIQADHVIGRQEPLLWLPDAICGAVVEHRCGQPANYLALERKITLITI